VGDGVGDISADVGAISDRDASGRIDADVAHGSIAFAVCVFSFKSEDIVKSPCSVFIRVPFRLEPASGFHLIDGSDVGDIQIAVLVPHASGDVPHALDVGDIDQAAISASRSDASRARNSASRIANAITPQTIINTSRLVVRRSMS